MPPHHQLGRDSPVGAWRRAAGIAVFLVLYAVAAGVIYAVAYGIHEPDLRGPAPAAFDQLWELGALLVLIAGAIPAVLLTVRWVEARPAGCLASVAGRLRWRVLGHDLLVAGAGMALYGGVVLAIAPPAPPAGLDWTLLAGTLALAAVLVPFQAAAEEYVFRGYLPQLIGAFVRNWWIPAIAISLLFALVHGSGDGVWATVNRAGFGLTVAYATLRTGGLEAAIVIHVLGNVLGLGLLAADGTLAGFLDFGAQPPQTTAAQALVDLLVVALITGVVVTRSRARPPLPCSGG